MSPEDMALLEEASGMQHTMAVDAALEELYGLDIFHDQEYIEQHLETFINQYNGVTWVFWDQQPLLVTWTTEFEDTLTTFTKLLYEQIDEH